MTAPDHTEVFFLNPKDGWAAAAFDAEGNQIGDALTAFHQRDAIRWIITDYPNVPCRVFTRDGARFRIATGAPAP